MFRPLMSTAKKFKIIQEAGCGRMELTAKEIEMDSHLGGHRWVRKASDLMRRKDIERVVPAGQHT